MIDRCDRKATSFMSPLGVRRMLKTAEYSQSRLQEIKKLQNDPQNKNAEDSWI